MNISVLNPSSSSYAPTVNRSGGIGTAVNSAGKQAESGKSGQLSPEDAAQVAKLKQIDRQVRQHEMAHMAAAAGMVTSGASFTYQKGPDGVNYAVAGEVGISTSPGRAPDETISRAQKIRAAALAPADPSSQDRAVAAAATQMEQEARLEKMQDSANAGSFDGSPEPAKARIGNFYAAAPGSTGAVVNDYA